MKPRNAYGLLPEDFEEMNAPARASHIFSMLQRPWTWREGNPFLKKETRAWLESSLDIALPGIVGRSDSEDGSVKLALRLGDGEIIEAVHMPREVRNPRVTLCISSQVGCAMDCAFCATGRMGFRRNLTSGEIVSQVMLLLRELGPDKLHAITLVFMGMGEPLLNLENVHRAVRILNHPAGLNISTRRITVSTSGIVPGIEKLAGMEPRPWLALSLNATTDAVRDELMPINRTYGLERLRQALSNWTLSRRERLTVEYVLIAGVNDSPEDARRLAAWMGDLRKEHNINLIRFNGCLGDRFSEPSDEAVTAFVAVLKTEGCFVTVRKSRGRDVNGACGQLASST
jgi:23S rRNA (adenine2503-C2)-methyltransferase